MNMSNWILDKKGKPVEEPDILKWAEWFERASKAGERRVAFTEIKKGLEVSTVFLGLDHNFSDVGPALLYETMVFRKGKGDDEERSATKEEALATHERIVKELS